MDRYAKGVLYVWTMPDNFNDLYALPPAVTSAIKNYVMRGFPVRLDGPGKVALFAYDNDTFIVESYLPTETDVKVSVTGNFAQLRNLVTGEEHFRSSPVGNSPALAVQHRRRPHFLQHSSAAAQLCRFRGGEINFQSENFKIQNHHDLL